MIIGKDKCKECLYICDCCKKRGLHSCSTCKPFGRNFDISSGCTCKLTGDTIKLIHKYKVGDKVRVIHELDSNNIYDNCSVTDDMVRFRGKDVTISKTYYSIAGKVRYQITEDNRCWAWSEEMFE